MPINQVAGLPWKLVGKYQVVVKVLTVPFTRERGLISPKNVDDVLFMLKDSRNEFFRKVAK